MILKPLQQHHGLTLVELLITIAIAGILFATAIPVFSQIFTDNQQRSVLFTLLSQHQLARSEAIRTNQRILLCKSDNGSQCTPQTQWQKGWIIFVDSDNNKLINDQERIVYIQQPLNNNLTLQYHGFGFGPVSDAYIRYYPDGHSTNGTFTLCNQHSEVYARALIISRTGRARIAQEAPGNIPINCT